jgi:hypothetical protein
MKDIGLKESSPDGREVSWSTMLTVSNVIQHDCSVSSDQVAAEVDVII